MLHRLEWTWRPRLSRVVCTFLTACPLLLAASPCLALELSSDIWPDDEETEDGQAWLYGEGVARSDAGWVTVTTSLRDPNAGELAVEADLGTGTARADVAYLIDANTVQPGDYSTMAVGEDEYAYHGCSLSWVGVQTVYFYLRRTGWCFPPISYYENQCVGIPCGESGCAASGAPYRQCVTMRFHTFFYWCLVKPGCIAFDEPGVCYVVG